MPSTFLPERHVIGTRSGAFFDYVDPPGVIARLDPKSGLPDFGTH